MTNRNWDSVIQFYVLMEKSEWKSVNIQDFSSENGNGEALFFDEEVIGIYLKEFIFILKLMDLYFLELPDQFSGKPLPKLQHLQPKVIIIRIALCYH